jgi:tetratricopeptide (TPR) repeat protein
VLGLLHEREDRILDAIAAYEKSIQLDPKAAPVHKAVVPLLLALERRDEALAATRKTLDIAPQDFLVWYLYARQLRARGDLKEACAALERAADCPAAKDVLEAPHQIQYDLGTLREQLGESAAAVAAYTRAAAILDRFAEQHHDEVHDELRARNAETYERVGNIHLQAKDYGKALDAFRAAQKRHPAGAARLSLNLAQLCARQGQHAEALTHLDSYLRLQPQGADAYEMKIDALGKLGRTGEVVPWLRQAAEADRYNVRLKLLLARECGRAGHGAEAEKAYGEAADLSPTPEVYKGLFALYRADKRQGVGKVLARLDATLGAGKGEVSAPGVLANQALAMIAAVREDLGLSKELLACAAPLAERGGKLSLPTLHLLGAVAERARDWAAAESFYRLALAGTTEISRPLQIGGLLRVLGRAKKHAEIVTVCREALKNEKGPNRILYLTELTRALARLEQTEEALRVADDAVASAGDAEKLAARLLRTRILVMAEQYDKAEAECLALLEKHRLPGEAMEIRYLLSGVYTSAHRYEKAEEQLEQCLKLDPENATLNNDLGYVWADRNKNLDRAEEMIRKAIDGHRKQRKLPGGDDEPQEDNASFVDSLGWVLYRKGDLQGARRELERAAALPDGDDPTIWDHLGDVYSRLDLRDDAVRAYRRAAHFYERRPRGTMNPRYREVRDKLRQLESPAQQR